MGMTKIAYPKQIGTKKEKKWVYHEAVYDVDGNVIEEPYYKEELVDVPINGTGYKYEEVLPIEEPKQEPTQLDVIEAQVMFTALMTDTLLEV